MLIATYGTLRKDGAYHYYIGKAKLTASGWLEGFKMYLYANWFPFAIKGSTSDRIKVEVYDVPEAYYKSTKAMETGAGFEEIEIEICYEKAKMFIVINSPRFKNYQVEENLIKSGDWIDFRKQQDAKND